MSLMAIALALAVQAAPFDLECAGTIHTGVPTVTDTTTADDMQAMVRALPSRPWSVRYRVDLAAQRWCQDTCEAVEPIQRLDPTRIIIDGVNINRTNLTAVKFRPLTQEWHMGSCRVLEFSGMPTAAF